MVYVISKDGTPLMPTERHGAVRRWLRDGKAKVVRRDPFTIQLLWETTDHVQEVSLGVDLGTAHVGLSAVTSKQEVFRGEAKLRTDLSEKLTDRRRFRRSRRSRKTRHRPPRFQNRRKPDGWLPPSVRAKVDETLKAIGLVRSILPITRITLEIGTFDPHQLKDLEVTGEGYQHGEQSGFWDVREYVLWRDHHTCQACKGKSKDPVLEVHHLRGRSGGGSNRPENLITLCKSCHWEHHHVKSKRLPVPPESLKDATQFNVLKSRVVERVRTWEVPMDVTFGSRTKEKRVQLSLAKGHDTDAFLIAGGEPQARLDSTLLIQFVRRQNRKLFKGARSHLRNTLREAKGFRRFDIVQFKGQVGFVFGLRSTGYFDLRRLDGTKISASASWRGCRRVCSQQTMLVQAA